MDKFDFETEEDISKRRVADIMMETVENSWKSRILLLSLTSFIQNKEKAVTGSRPER